MQIQRERNGNLLTIDFPVEALLKEIANERAEWEEYSLEVVNGNQDERVSPETVKNDIDTMIEKINYYSSDEKGIAELFDMLPLKKNNKLSKSSKPSLYTMNYGYYVEDCYGWSTQEIRAVATDELNAKVYMSSTIIHY